MHYSLCCLLGTVFICLFVPLIYYLIAWKKHKDTYKAVPHGHMGWPIVGETLEFVSLGKKGTPEKFMQDRMKKYSSEVFKTSLLMEKFVVFCGPSGNKFLFSNEDKLVNAWWPDNVVKIFKSPPGIGEQSKRLRSVLPEFLKVESLRKYIPIMDSMAKQHIKQNWCDKGEVIAFEEAKNHTFELACRLFLSIEEPEFVATISKHFRNIKEGFFALPIDLPGTTLNRSKKAVETILTFILPIIKQRRMELMKKGESATKDILSHMIVIADTTGLFADDADIANKIIGLLMGSHDSTTSAITLTLKCLAEFPHVYDKVFQEQREIAKSKKEGELLNWEDIQKMKYSWNVVCEAMRLTPPVPGTFREAITDFCYAGFTIPKGWKIHWNAYTTNKDPKYFPNPDEFDPSRFEKDGVPPFAFVPFGGGPRMCPGREYARLSILVFLHNTVNMFRWEKKIPNEKTVSLTVPTPKEGFPICLKPHEFASVH
ncbi:Cytochrome P450 [Dillenia turbinata]|uniref:Cytochrome P450 n=1 Tax=Dillenia turbinata TaxID=194707 RepID=A0AAN8ZEW4_9MAGN